MYGQIWDYAKRYVWEPISSLQYNNVVLDGWKII